METQTTMQQFKLFWSAFSLLPLKQPAECQASRESRNHSSKLVRVKVYAGVRAVVWVPWFSSVLSVLACAKLNARLNSTSARIDLVCLLTMASYRSWLPLCHPLPHCAWAVTQQQCWRCGLPGSLWQHHWEAKLFSSTSGHSKHCKSFGGRNDEEMCIK